MPVSETGTQSVHLRMKACSMTDRVTLFNHPSTANTIRYTSLNTYTQSTFVQPRRMLTKFYTSQTSPRQGHSLSLSHARKQLGLLQLARLGCFTKTTTNHEAFITMQYAEAGKDMHAHSCTHSSCTVHPMSQFYHHNSVTAKI